MNCQNAQDWLLQSDLSAGEVAPVDVAAHVSHCPRCQAFADKLRGLEQAARSLPSPAGAEASREAFLQRLQRGEVKIKPVRVSMPRVVKWVAAVAAMLLLAVGAGVLVMSLGTSQTAQASSVLDELVDWNLNMSDANSHTDRKVLYSAQVQRLEHQVQTGKFSADDRELADVLLKNGAQLARDDDPLTAAEGFTDVADVLVRQMSAAANENPHKVTKLNKYYARVTQHGINAKVDRVENPPPRLAERDRKLERVLQHNENLRSQLKTLLENSPNASREEIRRALDLPAPKHHKTQ